MKNKEVNNVNIPPSPPNGGEGKKKGKKLDLANLTLEEMDSLIEECFEVKDFLLAHSSFKVREGKAYKAKKRVKADRVEIFVFNPHTDTAKEKHDYFFYYWGQNNPYLFGKFKNSQ